jgi:hypothetical protein
MGLSEDWCNKSNLLLTNTYLYGPTSSVASILGVGGRDPQILKWVMVRIGLGRERNGNGMVRPHTSIQIDATEHRHQLIEGLSSADAGDANSEHWLLTHAEC